MMNFNRYPSTGNKSVVVGIVDDRNVAGEKGKVLKLHVYFDGTNNNRYNIDLLEEAIKNQTKDKANLEGLKKPDIHDYRKENGEIDYESYKAAKDNYENAKQENKKDIRKATDERGWRKKFGDALGTLPKNSVESVVLGTPGMIAGGVIAANDFFNGGIDPTKDSSYTEAYSNIPIMYDVEDDEEGKKEIILKVYIEGVGTRVHGKDSTLAQAIGKDYPSDTGIKAKLNTAFEIITNDVGRMRIQSVNFTSVEVCVMGFSRGAATARNFVSKRSKLLQLLRQFNKTITDKKLVYNFVGLFDTVCSATGFQELLYPKLSLTEPEYNDIVTIAQRNNIKTYKLALKDKAKKVVHLVAADEYRLFFPLTNIQSSINAGNGIEIVIPGSHSDVGGGYNDFIEEKYNEEVGGHGKLSPTGQSLKDNAWYVPNKDNLNSEIIEKELFAIREVYQGFSNASGMYGGAMVKKKITVGKKYSFKRSVTAGYSRIPLEMMLHYAQIDGKIRHKSKDHTDATKVHQDLESIKKEFVDYAKNVSTSGNYNKLVDHFNRQPNYLRSKYLHLSAILDNENLYSDIPYRAKFSEGALRRAILNDEIVGLSLKYYLISRLIFKIIKT